MKHQSNTHGSISTDRSRYEGGGTHTVPADQSAEKKKESKFFRELTYSSHPYNYLSESGVARKLDLEIKVVRSILRRLRWKKTTRPVDWAYDTRLAVSVKRERDTYKYTGWYAQSTIAAIEHVLAHPSGAWKKLGIVPEGIWFSLSTMSRMYASEHELAMQRGRTVEDVWSDVEHMVRAIGWEPEEIIQIGTVQVSDQGTRWYHRENLRTLEEMYEVTVTSTV